MSDHRPPRGWPRAPESDEDDVYDVLEAILGREIHRPHTRAHMMSVTEKPTLKPEEKSRK